MKRIVFIAAVQLTLGAAWAQQSATTQTRVSSNPCGRFYVDGTLFTGSATFAWPVGSSHILAPAPAYYLDEEVRCVPDQLPINSQYASCQEAWAAACSPMGYPCQAAPTPPCVDGGTWRNNNGNLLDGATITVVASPEITFYEMTSHYQYLVGVDVVDEDSHPMFSCVKGPDYGKLYVNGTCYDNDLYQWFDKGQTIRLQAYAPRGFVFTGWAGGPLGGIESFDTSVVVNWPLKIRPRFEPATRVTIQTVPPELKLVVDDALVSQTAMPLDWRRKSTHRISVVSPQVNLDTRQIWVFDGWAHGGEQTQDYTVWDSVAPLTLTANFAPGSAIRFLTAPYGMKLTIDGRDDWGKYDFTWKTGSTHQISAPLEQTDGMGRKYLFNSWTIPGGATMDYVVPENAAQVIAQYDRLGRLRIESPAGEVNMLVDGQPCRTPCEVDRKLGVTAQIVAPASITMDDVSQYEFLSFSDGGPRERTWTATTEDVRLTVNYQARHRIRAVADPANAATFTFSPPSEDGYYAAGADVTVTATPALGYRFKKWELDASGWLPKLTLKITRAISLRAILQSSTYSAVTTVKNAAGDNGEPGVAPGSLIAAYGVNMAPQWVTGPSSPLAQTLGGVRALVDDRILPLLFVSPGQINAQLPSDLAEGRYRLLVRGESQDDATLYFDVQRNSPGLFTMPVDDQPFGMILRPDKSVATKDNPAVSGEEVIVLGTGFGPYREGSIDGFATPLGMTLTVADPVEILVGDKTVTPISATAHPGWVGITAVKFKVGDAFTPGANVEFKVRVNGKESNKVLLPVK